MLSLGELYSQKVTGEVQDSGDQASSSSLETLKISLQDAEIEEYNRIIKALEMIEDGSYGSVLIVVSLYLEKRLNYIQMRSVLAMPRTIRREKRILK